MKWRHKKRRRPPRPKLVVGFSGDQDGTTVHFGDGSTRYFPTVRPITFAGVRRMLDMAGRRMSTAEIDHFLGDLGGGTP